MNAPKNRHSDDRKTHIASLVLVVPVVVSVRAVAVVVVRCSLGAGSVAWAIASPPPFRARCAQAYMPNSRTRTPGIASHGFLNTAAYPRIGRPSVMTSG